MIDLINQADIAEGHKIEARMHTHQRTTYCVRCGSIRVHSVLKMLCTRTYDTLLVIHRR
jgi:hypothetical protein